MHVLQLGLADCTHLVGAVCVIAWMHTVRVQPRQQARSPVLLADSARIALRITEDGKAGRARRLYEVKANLVAQLQSQGEFMLRVILVVISVLSSNLDAR